MRSATANLNELRKQSGSTVGIVRVGEIVDITEDGGAIVNFRGNTLGPVRARVATPVARSKRGDELIAAPVLLVFENGDPSLPIIVGIVTDGLVSKTDTDETVLSKTRPSHVALDGKTLAFDADREIVLRCGKSSITLRADGSVVVKGTRLVSRASRVNKIKGGTVSIN